MGIALFVAPLLLTACIGSETQSIFRTTGQEVTICKQSVRLSFHNQPLLRVTPAAVETTTGVGIVTYRLNDHVAYCLADRTGIGSWGQKGSAVPAIKPSSPLTIVATGFGDDKDAWVLVRVPPRTSRIAVAVAANGVQQRFLNGVFVVVSFPDPTVARTVYRSHGTVSVNVGTVTGFDRKGIAVGSAPIYLCGFGPDMCHP